MWRRLPLLVPAVIVAVVGAWYYASTLRGVLPPTVDVTIPLEASAASQSPTFRARTTPFTAPADPFAPLVGNSPVVEFQPPPPPTPEPPVVEVPVAPVPEEVPFKLTGIVTGSTPRAVLEGKATAHIVQEGDQIEGWLVLAIQPDGVRLRSPSGQEVRVELEERAP